MKQTAFALWLLLACGSLFATATFPIGGKPVVVPPPEGYVRVTGDMPLLKRFFDQLVDPMTDTLAAYVPESMAGAARRDGIQELPTYFILKVNKSLKGKSITDADFEAFRTEVINMQEQAFEEVKKRLEQTLKDVGNNLGQEFDADVAIGLLGLAPLRPHHSSKDMVAFSMLVDYGFSSATGSGSQIVATTGTLLDVSGSLALLSAFGDRADLEWTRSASVAWGDAILAANGLPVTSGTNIAARAPASGALRWDRVAGNVVIGAVVGGVAALIIVLVRRRKKA